MGCNVREEGDNVVVSHGYREARRNFVAYCVGDSEIPQTGAVAEVNPGARI